jgi:hypothetical protein
MLEDELQRIYDSEINVRISWLWDGGIDVRLGDEMNGYLAEENARQRCSAAHTRDCIYRVARLPAVHVRAPLLGAAVTT